MNIKIIIENDDKRQVFQRVYDNYDYARLSLREVVGNMIDEALLPLKIVDSDLTPSS